MSRFAFFIYRFNGPVMRYLLANPNNFLQMEQGVISMLAGDLFDTPRVLRSIGFFKCVYAVLALLQWRRWRDEHRYRLAQAQAQFSGGNTPLDR
jgi:hypothetical protein